MEPDDHVCLCFKVSLRKLSHYLEREEPQVASQLSDCLGAGTGCGWCVPQLEQLHEGWRCGSSIGLPGSAEERAAERSAWQKKRREEREAARQAASDDAPPA
jgi:bacterioferritin-associated ferredoxin